MLDVAYGCGRTTAGPRGRVRSVRARDRDAAALRKRTEGDDRESVFEGDSNAQIDKMASEVPFHGLNLALIDGYGITLDFAMIERLARSARRMDLIIHGRRAR